MIEYLKQIIDYLNQNSSLVTAVATVILAGVTIYYACITHKILKESENNRKSNFLPVVIVSKISTGKILVKNTGKGLAQNINFDSDIIRYYFFDAINFLCPDQEKIINYPRDKKFELFKENCKKFNIFYRDVYGRECTTKVNFIENDDYDCEYIAPK